MCVQSVRDAIAPFLANISDVAESAPSVIPWKQPINAKMFLLPVYFLASFNAASTAFVPVGPGN